MILNTLIFLSGALLAVFYAPIMEWLLHYHVMHKKVQFFGFVFDYAYKAHALVHHGLFRADDSYYAENHDPEVREANEKKIPMAWWNCLVLVPLASSPFLVLMYFSFTWCFVGIFTGIAAYYAAYEYFHLCMHKKKDRWFKATFAYRWLAMHHYIHHKKHFKNLNVIFPLADLLFGTLVTEKNQGAYLPGYVKEFLEHEQLSHH